MSEYKNMPELHFHPKSQFDSSQDVGEVIARLKELGMPGVALTDHGVMTAIPTWRKSLEAEGLKCIPGCELYVDKKLGEQHLRQHLIALACDDIGYHGLGKIDTVCWENVDSRGFPVIEESYLFDMMKKYQKHIIWSSACIQGVLATILLKNSKIDKRIAALDEKLEKYSGLYNSLVSYNSEKETAEKELEKLIKQKEAIELVAKQKFGTREKKVKKLEKENAENAEQARIALEIDKKKAEDAKPELDALKEQIKEAKSVLSQKTRLVTQTVNKLTAPDGSNRYESIKNEIETLEAGREDESSLFVEAEKKAEEYAKAAGKGFFYIELQYHGIPDEKKVYPVLYRLAKDINLPVVITNDVHITNNTKRDRLRRCLLRSKRFGEKFEEENAGDSELYLKDDNERIEMLSQILPDEAVKEGMKNIEEIFDRCNVTYSHENHYPVYDKTQNADALLIREIQEGAKKRFPEGLTEAQKKQFNHEYKVMSSMNYSDYHLVVKGYSTYAYLLGYLKPEEIQDAPLTIEELREYIKEKGYKNPGYMVGAGRGSAVGSEVCYSIGITHLDPMKYGLYFERFLNPERVSMPDIDMDFGNTIREKVIQYVINRYGKDCVAAIMTMNALAPKGAINDAAKFYGLRKDGIARTALGRQLSKDVPADVGTAFKTMVDEFGKVTDDENGIPLIDYLKKKYSDNEEAVDVLDWASTIEGAFTTYGAHAAGIVITDGTPISDLVPLMVDKKKGMMKTQMEKNEVEENGLLKFDFLGLITCDIITETLKEIEKNYGKIIDPLKIDVEDKKVYANIYSKARTDAVFQFESRGMKQMLKRFKPSSFEDLIILVSMFRPGPLQYLDDVIAVKNGEKEMTFLCPQLEPILGSTYGAIVYQEQVMQIFQQLAGYTLGGADNVRRYMSKKKADKLAHERQAFIYGDEERKIDGCVKRGISEEIANTLFDQMMNFARYAFNKAHAAAYAYNSYITAWLKEYYPVEFFMGALNWAPDSEHIAGLMNECRQCGVKVLAPDVNVSQKRFSTSDGKILFGLSGVKGVKDHADDIIRERKNSLFVSLTDFMMRVNPPKQVYLNLIGAGALDSFGKSRAEMKHKASSLAEILKKYRDKMSFIESAEMVLPVVERFTSNDELVNYQKEKGVKPVIKKTVKAEALEKRIDNAKEALNAINKGIEAINAANLHINEDVLARMQEEKILLGVYVTASPMDYYPSPEDVGTVNIADLVSGEGTAYGIITNLNIRKRRSDGADMAFFDLEDSTGKISVKCFAGTYYQYGKYVKDGGVVTVRGKIDTSDDMETEGTDNESQDDETASIVASSINVIHSTPTRYIMVVPNIDTFNRWEDGFRKRYEEADGHPFCLFDAAARQYIGRNYRVSGDLEKRDDVYVMQPQNGIKKPERA